ncbi:MAG: DUF4062 domain-containing protein [Chitinophagaceae bacterium]
MQYRLKNMVSTKESLILLYQMNEAAEHKFLYCLKPRSVSYNSTRQQLMTKRYQVFVSSTYADLKDERAKVIQTIMESDCIPAGMELFPSIDNEQFEFIKKIIDDCDYYILIIGGRYGSLSEDGLSYTEKEFDYAVQKGIKAIAFLHQNPDTIPLGKSEKNETLRIKLDNFKQKVSTGRLVKFWNSAEELPGLVALSLAKTIKTYPAVGWVRSTTVSNPEIYQELNDVRKENADLKNKLDKFIQQENNAKELANFNDKYKFNGIYSWYNSYHKHYSKSSWEVEISWSELFALFSPHLLNHPTDSTIKSKIGELLYSLTKDAGSSGTPTIADDDFQTIKIHYSALGLIEVNYSKTVKGGMGLFWNLTNLGKQLMTKLRAIKKEL